MGSNIGSEVLLYLYGTVCFCMILYNTCYNVILRRGEKRLKRTSRRLENEIIGQIAELQRGGAVSENHLKKLRFGLRSVKNMLTLDDVLNNIEKAEKDEKWHKENNLESLDRAIEDYLMSISPIIRDMAGVYGRRDNLQAAFFAYFVGKHRIWTDEDRKYVVDSMIKCLKRESFYCKVNALQALCSLADEDAVVKGLEIESAAEEQIHEKITTEILLDFSGNHEKLIGKLWGKFDDFSGGVQLAVLNYIRFQSGQWKDEMFAVMMDEERDKELRFSAIRYFAKYPWEKAEKFIIDLALSGDETKWEGSAICASALASYSGEEVIEALRRAVHSRNWYVRYNAAESLQKLGMNYEKLLDIIRGGDRYAREMVMYRLEENELMEGGEKAK